MRKLDVYLYIELYGYHMDAALQFTDSYKTHFISKIVKISLILLAWLIVHSHMTLAYAASQPSVDKQSSKQLNDPTMPKVAPPIEETADLKAAKPIIEEKSTINPVVNPIMNPGKLKLSIILIRTDDKTAVINEQIVREKDKISGYEVTAIKHNKVILKNPRAKIEPKKPKKPTIPGMPEKPEKPEKPEPDTFTELKLPSVIIKK